MNKQDLYDTRDRIVFLEHYAWGIVLSCWYPNGRLADYTVTYPFNPVIFSARLQ